MSYVGPQQERPCKKKNGLLFFFFPTILGQGAPSFRKKIAKKKTACLYRSTRRPFFFFAAGVEPLARVTLSLKIEKKKKEGGVKKKSCIQAICLAQRSCCRSDSTPLCIHKEE